MSQSKYKHIQGSMFDPLYTMTDRQLRKLENGWADQFRKAILPELIKLEDLFAPLYSSTPNSRPSTPTYLMLGMLMLKSMFGLTDEEMESRMAFSIDFQYALGTTSFDRQPINQRTLNRFRAANALYTEETGIDLMARFVEEMAQFQKKEFLGANRKRRMDSIMIDNGCRKLSRLQLAHVVTKNALSVLDENTITIPEGLHHYIEDFDENAVTYHSKLPAAQKLETAFRDACAARDLFPDSLKNCEEFGLLSRFISEQIIVNSDGEFESIRDGKELTSTTLNNPAEPESTIRKKAGEVHQGYVGNFAETVDLDSGRKIIDSVDFQQNICSDIKFAKDEIQKMAENGDTTPLVADGAYISDETVKMAAENGIEFSGTAMTGKETPDLTAEFVIDEEEQTVICPSGKAADRATYSEKTESWSASWLLDSACKDCPFHGTGECPLKKHKRVRSGIISQKKIDRAEMQRSMHGEKFEENYKFRNGVEAIPSQLRRDQNIDHLPFRGLLRKKQGYVLAVAAINARRVLRYVREDLKTHFEQFGTMLFRLVFVIFSSFSQTEHYLC